MSLTGAVWLVRMPRWLLVVTVALSLAALLLIANLPESISDSDNFKLNLEMQSVEHCVWMRCQSKEYVMIDLNNGSDPVI